MDQARCDAVDRLRRVLLDTLATPRQPALNTAELRQRAHDALGTPSAVPVAIEAVYRALRTLQRRGLVEQHHVKGRHAHWTLTRRGAAAAVQHLHHEPPERAQGVP